jgi:F-type H+-transporting ATPase subunit epsilon
MHVDIVSTEGSIYSGQAEQVHVSTVMGELGIWPRHAPLMSRLKPGLLRIVVKEGSEQPFFIPSGFIEVQPHVVTILADTVMRSEEFDEEAAKALLVVEKKATHVDYRDAELELSLALLRAMEQISKSSKHKSS